MNENFIDILKERAKKKIEERKINDAIEILRDIIFLLRKENRYEEANLIELIMNQYIDKLLAKEK